GHEKHADAEAELIGSEGKILRQREAGVADINAIDGIDEGNESDGQYEPREQLAFHAATDGQLRDCLHRIPRNSRGLSRRWCGRRSRMTLCSIVNCGSVGYSCATCENKQWEQ